MSSSRLSSATVFSPVTIRCTVSRLKSVLKTRLPSAFRRCSPMGPPGASYVPRVSSPNGEHSTIVTVTLETGLRKGELLELTWDRVDLNRGVIRLEVTKSGRRREVPMRQVVYYVLSQLPGLHVGRVWPAGSIRTHSRTPSRPPRSRTSTSTISD